MTTKINTTTRRGAFLAGVCALALFAGVLIGSPALAQEDQETVFNGRIDIGYRNLSVDGSERKYNEDYDGLDSGTFLDELVLEWSELDFGMADYVNINASGLGGEPYERVGIRVGRKDSYDLRFNQTRQRYLYNLFELIGDLDGHSWDTVTRRTSLALDIEATEALSFFVGYKDYGRTGDSLFMKDFSREVFLMEAPIDRRTRFYTVGADARIGAATLVVRQSLRRYVNDFDNTTEGDLGLEPDATTQLTFYDWREETERDAWLTDATFIAPLGDRVRLLLSYYGTLFGDEEMDSDVGFDAEGVAFNGDPVAIVDAFSRANMDQSVHLIDADLGIVIFEPLVVHLQYRQLDQETSGTLRQDLTGSGTVNELNPNVDYSFTSLGLLAELRPAPGLALRGGWRSVDRELNRSGYNSLRDEDFESDGDDAWVFGASWRPADWVNIGLDYEEADIDRAFTRVSPLEKTHARARLTFTPQPAMRLGVSYQDFDYENPTPDLTSLSEGSSYSVFFNHEATEAVSYALSWSRFEIDTEADVIFDGAGFGGPAATIPGRSLFSSESDVYDISVRWQPAQMWETRFGLTVSEAEGDNTATGTDINDPPAVPSTLLISQDFLRGEVGVTRRFDSGIFVGALVGVFDYDDRNDLLDYDGDFLELHIGMDF